MTSHEKDDAVFFKLKNRRSDVLCLMSVGNGECVNAVMATC